MLTASRQDQELRKMIESSNSNSDNMNKQRPSSPPSSPSNSKNNNNASPKESENNINNNNNNSGNTSPVGRKLSYIGINNPTPIDIPEEIAEESQDAVLLNGYLTKGICRYRYRYRDRVHSFPSIVLSSITLNNLLIFAFSLIPNQLYLIIIESKLKIWQRRYFILSTSELVYYTSEDELGERGSIPLQSIVGMVSITHDKKITGVQGSIPIANCIKIPLKGIQNKSIVIRFETTNLSTLLDILYVSPCIYISLFILDKNVYAFADSEDKANKWMSSINQAIIQKSKEMRKKRYQTLSKVSYSPPLLLSFFPSPTSSSKYLYCLLV